MRGLVEQKLKKLHYFPPRFRVQPPHTLLAAHPLFADLPPAAFRREARALPPPLPGSHALCGLQMPRNKRCADHCSVLP